MPKEKEIEGRKEGGGREGRRKKERPGGMEGGMEGETEGGRKKALKTGFGQFVLSVGLGVNEEL